ncbi:ABC transporter substrate-binding protein [Planococcus glaciei]|uniref:ABC transporter substrate-binding protein n=1 Tax=Planococcus glaciei TaxID=459472 RepID=A0A1G7WLN4_9BACL|nr:ABC transporter substrate-binding protein [Planococcus glaciei]KOF12000.1 ABC transporter substrate-binding protein [Planococcus glaciei]MBX0314572.1 ABC transporter substrate-binding protein [Planococcus glaciei]QKX49971.1 ABC transporter substrate-binding protein [Planococcus glaciei]SDG72130.1 multiple sugar transport system substrate-binding protein [Planococcus glaciei]
MNKLKVFIILIAGLALILSGCSGFQTNNSGGDEAAVNEDGKTVVDFWTFWGSEIRRPIIEQIITDFNESQDEIEVKHTYLPFGDIWTKELAAIAAGDPPDVVINDINATALRGQKKQAMNLSKFLEEDDISKRFYPELWDATLYEGDSYGIPFNTDTRVLFYNKDAFKEAGLDPEKPPTTWAELEEYAAKLDKKAGSNYDRVGFYPLWGIGYDVWLLNANGQSYFDDQDNFEVDTAKNEEVLNWLKSWKDKYGEDVVNSYQAQIDSQQGHPFFTGDLAMIAQAPTFYTQIRDYAPDLNFGVIELPEYEEGNGNTSWGGGFVAEIPEGSKNSEAAWEFIKYLTDVEAQEYWAVKNFDNVANIEAAEAAAKSDEFTEDGTMVYEKAVENMEHTLLTPVPVIAPDFTSLINPNIDEFLLGSMTAKEALAKSQADVENLIEKNK